jgi:exosome complex component RRP42
MAALAALNTTRMNKVEDNKIVHGEFSGKLKLKNQPLLATFAKVGGMLLLDPDMGEEAAMHARFSFGSTEDGTLTAFQKGGSGGMSMEEIQKSIDTGLKATKENRKKLKE